MGKITTARMRQATRGQCGRRNGLTWMLSLGFIAAGLLWNSYGLAAEEAPTERVNAKLTCGSLSANAKEFKSFQIDLDFDVYGSLWMADRQNQQHSGIEKFRGVLSPTGTMLVAGQGKSDSGMAWSYEFSGHKNSKGITVLKGSYQSEQPKGTRSCSLAF